ncbi:beta strand repeat-containing protein, partial [Patescibacteria group bacterium]
MLSASTNHLRKLGASRKSRKRVLGMVVFTAFSAYFFLSAVPVGAADSCVTLYGSSGSITISAACEFDAGTYSYDNVTVEGGVTVTMGNASTPGQVVLDIAGDFELCATCAMTATGVGNPAQTGTGAGATGTYGSGAGYGGLGGVGRSGAAAGSAYGSVTAPNDLGSGGGHATYGGIGGGAMKLLVDGTLTLNGTVSANGNIGGSYYGGGGSGGSIYIDAGSIAGTSTLSTDGGAGSNNGGAGGGGRIAVYYTNDASSSWTYSSSGGSSSYEDGGAGTVYVKQDSATYGDLTVDNINHNNPAETPQVDASLTMNSVTLKNGAYYQIPSAKTLGMDPAGSTLTGSGTEKPVLSVESGGELDTGATSFSFTGIDLYQVGTISTVTDLTVGDGAEYVLFGTGQRTFTSLTIANGGKLTHAANTATTDNAIDLAVTDLTVAATGEIDVDGKGFAAQSGDGAGGTGTYGSGAGYGGHGGTGRSGAAGGTGYGSAVAPTTLGSGGGHATYGGAGGGVVKLTVSGTLTLNGDVTANGNVGGSYYGGGGSGGSIYIDTGSITGTSTISSDGGAGSNNGGGGAGGRIAVYYTNDASSSWTYSSSGGSSSYQDGGAGTVYVKQDSATYGDLTIDNINHNNPSYTSQIDSALTLANIIIKNGAFYKVPSAKTIALSPTGTLTGSGTEKPVLQVESNGEFDIGTTAFSFTGIDLYHAGTLSTVTDLTVGNGATYVLYGTDQKSFTSLTVADGAVLTHGANTTTTANIINLAVTDLTVAATGEIDVDSKGLRYDYGTGASSSAGYYQGSGGAGHGGKGGSATTAGGTTYGSVKQPSLLGSGAGSNSSHASGTGAYGGGAVKIVATGTVDIDGTISANGGNGPGGGGGGSGGSVWIDADVLTGTSGTITANGGNGYVAGYVVCAGGGGGGRVAIYYNSDTSTGRTNTATGGTGYRTGVDHEDGGGGTVFIDDKNDSDTNGELIVGNADHNDPNYTTQVTDTTLVFDHITVKDGAMYQVPDAYTLELAAGGSITGGGTQQASITVDAGTTGGTFDTGSTSFTYTGMDINFHYEGNLDTAQDLSIGSDAVFRLYDIGTFTLPGTLTVLPGGELTHAKNYSTKAHTVNVVAANIDVDASGLISADELGYYGTTGNNGPGGAADCPYYVTCAGASHGGLGGYSPDRTVAATYGSVREPTELGSGGGDYGYNSTHPNDIGPAGGGAIKLTVSGTLTLDGDISADGDTALETFSGGGAGGSIWINANTIAGTSGTVGANGGSGSGSGAYGPGGSGGRVALYYTNGDHNNWDLYSFGGDGYGGFSAHERDDGGPGSVFVLDLDHSDTYGWLFVANDVAHSESNYTDQTDDSSLGDPTTQRYDTITIADDARYRIPDTYTLELADGGTLTGDADGLQPELFIDTGTTGGEFDPINRDTWTFLDIDVTHYGALATVQDLTVDNGRYVWDSDDGTFPATLDDLIVESGGVFSQKDLGTIAATTVTVKGSGSMTHEDNASTQEHRLVLDVTTLTVDSSGSINVDEVGYDGTYGPGGAIDCPYYVTCAGASHGGLGGDSPDNDPAATYGSIKQPITMGSGSGDYGYTNVHPGNIGPYGGGTIRIKVSGTMTLNGEISADGMTAQEHFSGGGAGGSVWITADTIAGTSGTVGANGGSGLGSGAYGPGGGGGRVALYYTDGDYTNWDYYAVGGDGNGGFVALDDDDGGAGTIYILDEDHADTYGWLFIANGNRTESNFTDLNESFSVDNLDVSEGARYRLGSGVTFSLETGGVIDGEGTVDGELHILDGATFNPQSSDVTVTGVDVYLAGSMTGVNTMAVDNANVYFTGAIGAGVTSLTLNANAHFRNSSNNPLFSGSTLDVGSGATYEHDTTNVLGVDTVYVRTNGTITHTDNSTSKDSQVYLSATNMTIESGGEVNVSGLGFDGDYGTGAGSCSGGVCGGGGYGGPGEPGGGGAGGTTYGSETAPTDMGSGGGVDGGTGSGGGVIRLVVSNTLSHSGVINANGGDASSGDSGGGAGGSIWIDAGTIICNTSTISADGGNGYISGGDGGGGRIAIYYTNETNCSTVPTVDSPAGASYEGTFVFTENAPSIDSFTVTPSDPTVNTVLTAYAQVTYLLDDIDTIVFYVDGSPPASGEVHTCAWDGGDGSGGTYTCSYEIGTLPRGDHTITVIANAGDGTSKQEGLAISVSAETTLNRPHFDRLQINEPDVPFTLSFELAGTSTGTLTISFPSGFSGIDVTSATGTCSDAGTIAGWSAPDTRTAQATKTGCAGTVSVSGITIDLPGDVDSYVIEWSNDDGAGAVAITDDDQITVSSNVDPSITFDIDV